MHNKQEMKKFKISHVETLLGDIQLPSKVKEAMQMQVWGEKKSREVPPRVYLLINAVVLLILFLG